MGQRKRSFLFGAMIIGAMAVQAFAIAGSAGANGQLSTVSNFRATITSPYSATLRWSDISNEDSYRLTITETRDHFEFVGNTVQENRKTTVSYISAQRNATSVSLNLIANAQYSVDIHALRTQVNKDVLPLQEETIELAKASVTFTTPPDDPLKPNVQATANGAAIDVTINTMSADLTEKNNNGPIHTLRISVGNAYDSTLIATDGSTYKRTISNLTGATTYDVRVEATYFNGRSATSTRSVTTPLASPSNVAIDPSSGTLRWDAVSGAKFYLINDFVPATGTGGTYTVDSETTYQIPNFDPEKSYFFEVTAKNKDTITCRFVNDGICSESVRYSYLPNRIKVDLAEPNNNKKEHATLNLLSSTSGTYTLALPAHTQWGSTNLPTNIAASLSNNMLTLSFTSGTLKPTKITLIATSGKPLVLTITKTPLPNDYDYFRQPHVPNNLLLF